MFINSPSLSHILIFIIFCPIYSIATILLKFEWIEGGSEYKHFNELARNTEERFKIRLKNSEKSLEKKTKKYDVCIFENNQLLTDKTDENFSLTVYLLKNKAGAKNRKIGTRVGYLFPFFWHCYIFDE